MIRPLKAFNISLCKMRFTHLTIILCALSIIMYNWSCAADGNESPNEVQATNATESDNSNETFSSSEVFCVPVDFVNTSRRGRALRRILTPHNIIEGAKNLLVSLPMERVSAFFFIHAVQSLFQKIELFHFL